MMPSKKSVSAQFDSITEGDPTHEGGHVTVRVSQKINGVLNEYLPLVQLSSQSNVESGEQIQSKLHHPSMIQFELTPRCVARRQTHPKVPPNESQHRPSTMSNNQLNAQ
jgi:hypothetical protein